MQTSIQFRRVDVSEWELVKQLEHVCQSLHFFPCKDDERYKEYIQESTVYVLEQDDNAVGTISYKIEPNGSALINGLTVIPEFRQQGIAKAAMQQLLEELSGKNVTLTVHPHNTAALLIYLHFGFEIQEWKDNYYGDGEPRLVLLKHA